MGETFAGGNHITGYKELSKDKQIIEMPIPSRVAIPLSQHTGIICEPMVKESQLVRVGTKIGQGQGLISSSVHASISGKVTKITDYNHPVLGVCKAVIIDSDGQDELEPGVGVALARNIKLFSKEQLLEIIKNAGIVGLGGAAFPTQVKLNPPKPVEFLIINGAECEPYLSCDFRIMLERSQDILKGVSVVQQILNVRKVLIGVEDDKQEAIKALRNKIAELKLDFAVVGLKTKYPQGAEKQLIKALLDREVPPGKLPFDVGVVVLNVGTVLAVGEAVFLNKPLYERVVTVTGKILKNPANLKVRLGTRFSELINFCGGIKGQCEKIIMGGPMMGIAQCTDDVPVIKGTSGILLLSKSQTAGFAEQPCIRCGRCVDICPMRMLPYLLSQYGQTGHYQKADGLNVKDCMECGACVYICPAKRRILEHIRLLKTVLK
ncbi:MAG: electron transport complex subunit RsxC [Candidatus Omnitrophica bacterium]|nr:electron transport complex subunit RsxC [Candidatus Omnitrophota bacterium]MBU1925528.1 electron transport complex subunit RsxC [Candidatus Omnitrophota bacterium]